MNQLNTIKDESLSFLSKQLEQNNWSDEYKLLVIKEYEKFLCIRASNPQTSPSNNVDVVWHQHILNTRHYREYCIKKFGCQIDHDPTDAFDQFARKVRLKNTYNEYKKRYGEPPFQIWKELPNLNITNTTAPQKQNKKLIWYNNKKLYDDHKNGKEILKLIFDIAGITSYKGSTIMYLSNEDITLGELSKIIDERIQINSQNYKIRWMTKDPKQSFNKLTNKSHNGGSRHYFDLEPEHMNLSYYYNSHIQLIASYHHSNDGC